MPFYSVRISVSLSTSSNSFRREDASASPWAASSAHRSIACALVVLWVLLGGCGGESDSTVPGAAVTGEPSEFSAASFTAPNVTWRDVTGDLGISAKHVAGIDEDYGMPAFMGGGLAVFDLEGDGDLDLYMVQSGESLPYAGSISSGNVLLRNDGDRFVDVSAGSGADDHGYGMGVAVGDVDADGRPDLFVSNYGEDVLLRNLGEGRFEDVTGTSGLKGGGWSSSAVFFDYDEDGLLDLFVARYVEFDRDRVCRLQSGQRDFCGPAQFPGIPDRLFRNLGGLRFEDVSRFAGIETRADRGLGVAAADFDGDGRLDLYVANDSDPNHLWINAGDGRFTEDGLLMGLALNRFGVGEAGMGVSAGDVDGDGDVDLFVSHLIEETNTLYENRGVDGFEDVTSLAGLGVASMGYTGFGTALADFDNDGRLDLAVANGAVKQRPSALVDPDDSAWQRHNYAEPNQIFWNVGEGGFASSQGGDFTDSFGVSRGLLPADLDGDGDLDLVTSQIDGPLQVFRNEGGDALGSLAVTVLDGGRTALGAQVEILGAGDGQVRSFAVQSIGGYLTSGESPFHVGVDQRDGVDGFRVTWLDGATEMFGPSSSGDSVVLTRGEGEAQ